jgi:hypothetical protein
MAIVGKHQIYESKNACAKLHVNLAPLLPALSLTQTGSKATNMATSLLKCEIKHGARACPQCGDVWKECTALLKTHDKCFAAVMGSGAHEGKNNCGAELENLVVCVSRRTKVASMTSR